MTFRNQPVKSLRRFAPRVRRPGIDAYNESLRILDDNEEEAFRLNAIAADEGLHDALLAMGWFYLNGVGVKENVAAATHWYKKAARSGDLSAFFSLGHIAYLQADFALALVWLNRAVDRGHERAKFFLGKLYWRGNGVRQDRKKARRLFAEAAAANVAAAQRTERFLSFLGSKCSQVPPMSRSAS